MSTPEYTLKELEAEYLRGCQHGYTQGLRDGQLSPAELAERHANMRAWSPKRRTDLQQQKADHE